MSSTNEENIFPWELYLRKTNGVPADLRCFKQHPIPPQNKFKLNTLLEAVDLRAAGSGKSVDPVVKSSNVLSSNNVCNYSSGSATSQLRRFRSASYSLAYVVEIYGPRIRVRLVGTDDRNDCWFMIDSDQIRPYPSGEPLQPPLGYMKSHSYWIKTLEKAKEEFKVSKPACFVKQPHDPMSNKFCVGDKLEAVDRRNAQLICVATIGDVLNDMVMVNFDGWSGTFDYWTRYDNRDLFPVGWCGKAGHSLQFPGASALEQADMAQYVKMQQQQLQLQNDHMSSITAPTTPTTPTPVAKEMPTLKLCLTGAIKMPCTKSPHPRQSVPIDLNNSACKLELEDCSSPKSKSLCERDMNRRSEALADGLLVSQSKSVVRAAPHPPKSPDPTRPPIGLLMRPSPELKREELSHEFLHVPYHMVPVKKDQKSQPSNWSIDDVCCYLSKKDPSLYDVCKKFREHEIDGHALLLLRKETLQLMQLKVGPILKIDHLIRCLRCGYC